MRHIVLVLCILGVFVITGCGLKKTKTQTTKTFVSTKCETVCNNTSCNQVCVTVDGTLK